MSRSKWILEIIAPGGGGDHIAKLEFATLPSMRVALTEHHGEKFFVTMPDNVTSDDRNTLLDLKVPRLRHCDPDGMTCWMIRVAQFSLIDGRTSSSI